MLISIIIPVYNVEQYLCGCLDSIVEQTFSDYEIICVNDGSTDNSLAILREYESKHTNIVIIESLNKGTASARNIGIENSHGDYIWFIDSDDWIENDALQVLHDNLISKSLDVLCFNGKLKYEEDGRFEQDLGFEEKILSGWEYYNSYVLIKRKFHFVCVVIRLYRREFLLNRDLLFNESILHEDNLWIPLVMYWAQSVAVIPNSMYIYRIRKGSKMQIQSFIQIEDTIEVTNLLSDFFSSIEDIDKQKLYRVLSSDYLYAFSKANIKLFGNKDKELKKLINWKMFSTVINDYKRFYYYLILINPALYRLADEINFYLRRVLCLKKI